MGLLRLLFRRQEAVENQLAEYLEHWWECLECLATGMRSFLEQGPGEDLDFHYAEIDRHESRGDDLRRAIERELYEKALLPEARGDILRVLEAMDKVINRAESTIRQLVIERLELEPWMSRDVGRITEKTVDGCRALRDAAAHLLAGRDEPIPDLVRQVSAAESRCDHLEEDLLGRIFAAELELARKLQLKDFVRRVGTVSDLAETAADLISIVSVKRRV